MARRGGRTQVVQRQWIMEDLNTLSVGIGSGSATRDLAFGDNENALVPRGSLCRLLMCCSLYAENLQATPSSLQFASLGLVLTDPELGNSLNVLAADDADRSWVYRHYWRLPKLPVGQAFSGLVDLQGDTYNLDWQLRSGRGSSPQHDAIFRMVFSCQSFAATLIRVDIKCLQLWEN